MDSTIIHLPLNSIRLGGDLKKPNYIWKGAKREIIVGHPEAGEEHSHDLHRHFAPMAEAKHNQGHDHLDSIWMDLPQLEFRKDKKSVKAGSRGRRSPT